MYMDVIYIMYIFQYFQMLVLHFIFCLFVCLFSLGLIVPLENCISFFENALRKQIATCISLLIKKTIKLHKQD